MALNEIEMYFFGLICHVGNNDKKEYALLVDDVEHKPEIVIGDGAGNTTALTLNKGDVVSLNIIQGQADASGISSFAPHLSKLVKRNDGQAPRIDRTKSVAMLLAYPRMENQDGSITDGMLLSASFYQYQAKYKLGAYVDGPHCVPRLVVLKFTTKQMNVEVTINGALPRPVPRGGWILLADRSKQEGQHFERHRTLTDANVAGMVDATNIPCNSTPERTNHGDEVLAYLLSLYDDMARAELEARGETKDMSSSIQAPSPAMNKFVDIDPASATSELGILSILQQVECSNTNWP